MPGAPRRQAPSPTGRPEPDAGSATVELAAAIPLLVAITLAMVGLLGVARDHVLAQGAAREAAREAAVGGDADPSRGGRSRGAPTRPPREDHGRGHGAQPGPGLGGAARHPALRGASAADRGRRGRRPRTRPTPNPDR